MKINSRIQEELNNMILNEEMIRTYNLSKMKNQLNNFLQIRMRKIFRGIISTYNCFEGYDCDRQDLYEDIKKLKLLKNNLEL